MNNFYPANDSPLCLLVWKALYGCDHILTYPEVFIQNDNSTRRHGLEKYIKSYTPD
jgi:hypothetical protein